MNGRPRYWIVNVTLAGVLVLFTSCSPKGAKFSRTFEGGYDPEAGWREQGYSVRRGTARNGVRNAEAGYAWQSWQGVLTTPQGTGGCEAAAVIVRDSLNKALGGSRLDELTQQPARAQGQPLSGLLRYNQDGMHGDAARLADSGYGGNEHRLCDLCAGTENEVMTAPFQQAPRLRSDCKILRAKPEDAITLTRIAMESKRHWGYSEKSMEIWRESLTIRVEFIVLHETYSATIDGDIVGFYGLRRDNTKLLLEHLWILPGMMGRGIGRALFSHAVQRARASGFASLEIESDPNAAGFYERVGAHRIGANIPELEGQRRELPVLIYKIDAVNSSLEATS